jgi:16S rRNA (guanine966-N2)-methyltransferase
LPGPVCRSGALGLEALSRGAASVVFVEHQRAAVNALRALLRDWQASGATVVCDEAQHYLAAARPGARWRPRLRPGISRSAVRVGRAARGGGGTGARRAGARGPHLCEQHADDELQQALPASWRELRTGKAGEVRYHLYAAQ